MNDNMYKILEKAKMPDGTAIQIEDWKAVYPGTFATVMIAAYPKAKVDSTWSRKGETFRLSIDSGFNSDEEVQETFNRLRDGEVSLEDLEKHYRDDKARYYMGLVDTWDRPERS